MRDFQRRPNRIWAGFSHGTRLDLRAVMQICTVMQMATQRLLLILVVSGRHFQRYWEILVRVSSSGLAQLLLQQDS